MCRLKVQLPKQQHQFQGQQECQCLLDLKNDQNEQLIEELKIAKDASRRDNQTLIWGDDSIHPLQAEWPEAMG